MQDVLRVNAAGDLTVEWNFLEKDLPGVVLHDRLMTDAALGTRPIKTEHSYSLNSDGDSLPDSPISSHKMDGKCFSAFLIQYFFFFNFPLFDCKFVLYNIFYLIYRLR